MPRTTIRNYLDRLNPLRGIGKSRRQKILREVVIPLHGVLEQVHQQYLQAYEALVAEMHADPKYASNRIIDSVQDARRHLKTYQLLLPEGRPDAQDAWMSVSERLELLGHALAWSSKAFKAARDRLGAVTRVPDAPQTRRSDAYFQALTMYHTIRSRGALTFRLYPERVGVSRLDFRPGTDLEATLGGARTPVAQVVTFLVYERTDETVTRELAELIEGALWTKRSNWRAVETAFQDLLEEVGESRAEEAWGGRA